MSPTRSSGSRAPANPAETSCAGWYNAITASAARRAGSTPIPPHTATVSPRSKKMNVRPSYSRSTRREILASPLSSRSSAATIAIPDVDEFIPVNECAPAVKAVLNLRRYSGAGSTPRPFKTMPRNRWPGTTRQHGGVRRPGGLFSIPARA